jgi:hypothetical protein
MGTILTASGIKNVNNSNTQFYSYDMGAIGANGGTKVIDIAPYDQDGWLQFWVDVRHNNNTNAISANRKIAFGNYSTGGVKRNEAIIPDLATSGSTISFSSSGGVFTCTLTNNYAGAIYNCKVLILTCGCACYINGDSANGTF